MFNKEILYKSVKPFQIQSIFSYVLHENLIDQIQTETFIYISVV